LAALVGLGAVSNLLSPCGAALQPEEIAILAVRGSRDSEGLAKYYAKARGIPEENICTLIMPKGETLARKEWTWAIRPEIQKWIADHDPDEKIRCLVTTWDVPLRIGRAPANDRQQRYQQFLKDERTHRLTLLNNVLQALEKLALEVRATGGASPEGLKDSPETKTPTDKPGEGLPASEAKQKLELEQIQPKLDEALKRAQAHLANLPQEDEKKRGFQRLQQLATAIGGTNILLQGLNQQLAKNANGDPAVRSNFDRLRGRTIAYVETRAALERMAPGIERDALQLMILERTGGLIATVKWLEEQLVVVRKNETGASFDSELSLVMWPDDYQLLRWQPNYLRPEYKNSQLPKIYRTLMVARIDAPTLELAKGLVDTAIQVETEGLQGKVYIDTRGIGKLDQANVQPGSYADYDRALLITAEGIDKQTDLDVVLETSPKLFQPGECPDAALYCGWYSLAKYVDAFHWAPGAVAYHLASSEATTLRKPKSQVWCKRMLEEGVCATIGPVYEPYLMAFPRPNEFFSTLLAGKLTLVEIYYLTKPYNSWMMTLIGDPLYRPFANRDGLKE
jgi:uncharacterized protein (TIGR03790 family)